MTIIDETNVLSADELERRPTLDEVMKLVAERKVPTYNPEFRIVDSGDYGKIRSEEELHDCGRQGVPLPSPYEVLHHAGGVPVEEALKHRYLVWPPPIPQRYEEQARSALAKAPLLSTLDDLYRESVVILLSQYLWTREEFERRVRTLCETEDQLENLSEKDDPQTFDFLQDKLAGCYARPCVVMDLPIIHDGRVAFFIEADSRTARAGRAAIRRSMLAALRELLLDADLEKATPQVRTKPGRRAAIVLDAILELLLGLGEKIERESMMNDLSKGKPILRRGWWASQRLRAAAQVIRHTKARATDECSSTKPVVSCPGEEAIMGKLANARLAALEFLIACEEVEDELRAGAEDYSDDDGDEEQDGDSDEDDGDDE